MTKQTSEGSRVAILGCANETRVLAPFDDLSWEIWPHGAYAPEDGVEKLVPRWDVWFESHNPETVPPNIKSHIDWLAAQTKPVMVWTPNPPLQDKKQFDWRRLVDKFGKEFFTSTTAWMMAHAIMGGYQEIGLFGIEMVCDDEYAYQRAGVKHFQYIAEQYHGIKVTIPRQSELCREKTPYPFGAETPMALLVHDLDKKANAQLDEITEQLRMHQEALNKVEGARGIINRFKRYHTFE